MSKFDSTVFPLAEVFGFPTTNETAEAKHHRQEKKCPFLGGDCIKYKESNSGVCSTYLRSGGLMITCPQRFEEDNLIFNDSIDFIFGGDADPDQIGIMKEKMVPITSENYNMTDFMIVKLSEDLRVIDFGPVEVQSVYNMNQINAPFDHYMESGKEWFDWNSMVDEMSVNYPSPDILSSIKRLVFQMLAKGKVYNEWGKKQVFVTEQSFYDYLGLAIPEVDYPKDNEVSSTGRADSHGEQVETSPAASGPAASDATIAWFLYELNEVNQDDQEGRNDKRFKLERTKKIYTTYEKLISGIHTVFEAQDLDEFLDKLTDRYRRKDRKERYNQLDLFS
jgi:hypothetical protein